MVKEQRQEGYENENRKPEIENPFRGKSRWPIYEFEAFAFSSLEPSPAGTEGQHVYCRERAESGKNAVRQGRRCSSTEIGVTMPAIT